MELTVTLTDVGGDGPTGVLDSAADTFTIDIEVENTGDETLTGILVTDGARSFSLPAFDLGVGESRNVEFTLLTRQEWLDANGIDTLNEPDGDGDIDIRVIATANQPTDDFFDVSVPLLYDPSATFEKTVIDVAGRGPDGAVEAVGDFIIYQLVAVNDGTVTLDGAAIRDNFLEDAPSATVAPVQETGGTGTNGDGVFDPGETWTITATYTVTEADFYGNDKGDQDIDNTATLTTDLLADLTDIVSVAIRGGVKIMGTNQDDTITASKTVAGELLPTDRGDIIIGRKGEDKLKGLDGNDWIVGGKQRDIVVGGNGEDAFVFKSPPKKKHADTIKDYEVGVDKIVLSSDSFGGIGSGALAGKYFKKGKEAGDKSDKILYQKSTGKISYDADGSKPKSDPKLFAKVDKGLKLNADDFFVV